MNKILKKIFIMLSTIALLLGLLVFSILWVFSNNLPDYKFLLNYKPPVSSKMYSGNGEVVAEFSREKRIFVPYNAIPKNVINSFLAAEDKNFFSHPGIDAKGVIRAILKNIQNNFEATRYHSLVVDRKSFPKSLIITAETKNKTTHPKNNPRIQKKNQSPM